MSRILVIDKQPLMREMLSDALTPIGHEIRQTGKLKQALLLLEQFKFDIIIIDIQMEHSKSADTIKLLKQKTTAKIIAISGSDVFHENNKHVFTKKWGVDDLLPKPFNIEQLMNSISISSAESQ
jgi:DNA-binding response OmpR family regulator